MLASIVSTGSGVNGKIGETSYPSVPINHTKPEPPHRVLRSTAAGPSGDHLQYSIPGPPRELASLKQHAALSVRYAAPRPWDFRASRLRQTSASRDAGVQAYTGETLASMLGVKECYCAISILACPYFLPSSNSKYLHPAF